MMSDDDNFKNLFLDFSLGMLKLTAPKEAARLPPGVKIDAVRQQQLKERLGYSFRELDVPLRVKFPDGSREAIIFVVENESRNRKDFLH